MSVVINTNSAATMAADNLAQSTLSLQKSLNRLSSGSRIVSPADDAGGLAVSMKLTATAHRQAAVANNIANATSFLQTQDGVLNVVGKVLSRMSELRTLYDDPTKNTTDKGNYNVEFTQLQSEITSLAGEKFNGISLFGSSGLTLSTTAESNGTSMNFGAAALTGSSPAFATFTEPFNDLSNWTNQSFAGGTASAAGGTLDLFGSSGLAQVTSVPTFSGALSVALTLQFPTGSTDNLQIDLGGQTLANVSQMSVGDNGTHTLRVDYDGTGTANAYLDNSSTALATTTGLGVLSGALALSEFGFQHTLVSGLTVTSTSGSGNVADAIGASGLGAVNLGTLTSALQDVATLRANNGAEQSRLGFAADVLTTNKANIEAANSRIVDVDVAEESTRLARYNVLTQAGTAMLSQANQSTQIALKLLG